MMELLTEDRPAMMLMMHHACTRAAAMPSLSASAGPHQVAHGKWLKKESRDQATSCKPVGTGGHTNTHAQRQTT